MSSGKRHRSPRNTFTHRELFFLGPVIGLYSKGVKSSPRQKDGPAWSATDDVLGKAADTMLLSSRLIDSFRQPF